MIWDRIAWKRYRYGSKVYIFCLESIDNQPADMLLDTLEPNSSNVTTDSSTQPTTATSRVILVYNINSCTT
jgi:hypothetical protein